MKQTLVLVGSGEFTKAMQPVDRFLIQKICKERKLKNSKDLRVAIIPTAAGQEHDAHKWIEDGTKHFKTLGVSPLGLPIFTKADIKTVSFSQLASVRFFYFSGGDPGYLLQTLKGTKLLSLILFAYRKGAILTGSSAGAMIFGNPLLANAQQVFLNGFLQTIWKRGVGLINYSVFPHYDKVTTEFNDIYQRVMTNAPKKVQERWLGIDENTALIITNEHEGTVMGKGKIHILHNQTYKMFVQTDKLTLF